MKDFLGEKLVARNESSVAWWPKLASEGRGASEELAGNGESASGVAHEPRAAATAAAAFGMSAQSGTGSAANYRPLRFERAESPVTTPAGAARLRSSSHLAGAFAEIRTFAENGEPNRPHWVPITGTFNFSPSSLLTPE